MADQNQSNAGLAALVKKDPPTNVAPTSGPLIPATDVVDNGPVSDSGGSVILRDDADMTGVMIQTDTKIEDTATVAPRTNHDQLAIQPAEEEGEQTDYTYRHKTIRNFSIGQWEFQNHILVVHGAKANRKFLDLLGSTPESERSQIVVWHPEVMSQLERPVDYNKGIVRGVQTTSSIRDPKTNPGTPDKPDIFAGFTRSTP